MSDIIIDSTNSHLTIEEADTEVNFMWGQEEWLDLTQNEKARLLATATRQIDALPVKLAKASTDQPLRFPVVNPPGKVFNMARVKRAVLLQALYLYENSSAISEAQAGMIQGVRSEGVGPLSKSMAGFNPLRKYADGVMSALLPYIDMSFKTARG